MSEIYSVQVDENGRLVGEIESGSYTIESLNGALFIAPSDQAPPNELPEFNEDRDGS